MAHLDYRQASSDLPRRVAGCYRKAAKTIAVRDQLGPLGVMKGRSRRLSGHEVCPARITELHDGEAAHALTELVRPGQPGSQ